jgi:hypothetical protein
VYIFVLFTCVCLCVSECVRVCASLLSLFSFVSVCLCCPRAYYVRVCSLCVCVVPSCCLLLVAIGLGVVSRGFGGRRDSE